MNVKIIIIQFVYYLYFTLGKVNTRRLRGLVVGWVRDRSRRGQGFRVHPGLKLRPACFGRLNSSPVTSLIANTNTNTNSKWQSPGFCSLVVLRDGIGLTPISKMSIQRVPGFGRVSPDVGNECKWSVRVIHPAGSCY